nr:hypothetical protein [Pandoravirus massiliensis]
MHGDGGVLVFRFRYRHQKQWREARCPKGPRWESVRYWLEKRAGLLRASSSRGACASYIEGCRETPPHHPPSRAQQSDSGTHGAKPLVDDDEIHAHDALVLAVRPVVWRAHAHQPFVPVTHRRKQQQQQQQIVLQRGRRRDAIERARADGTESASVGASRTKDEAQWTLMDEGARIEAVAAGDTIDSLDPHFNVTRSRDNVQSCVRRRDDPPDVHPSNLDANARGHPPLKAWVDQTNIDREQTEQRRASQHARLLAAPDPLGPLCADYTCMSCGAVGDHRTARCPRACEPGYRPLSERRMPAGQPRDAFRPALEWERDQALVRFPNRADPSGRVLFFMRRSVPPTPRPHDWPVARRSHAQASAPAP